MQAWTRGMEQGWALQLGVGSVFLTRQYSLHLEVDKLWILIGPNSYPAFPVNNKTLCIS